MLPEKVPKFRCVIEAELDFGFNFLQLNVKPKHVLYILEYSFHIVELLIKIKAVLQDLVQVRQIIRQV